MARQDNKCLLHNLLIMFDASCFMHLETYNLYKLSSTVQYASCIYIYAQCTVLHKLCRSEIFQTINSVIYIHKVVISDCPSVCLSVCLSEHNSGTPGSIGLKFDWGTRKTHWNVLILVLRF